MPRRLISCGLQPVMSRPWKNTRPPSGGKQARDQIEERGLARAVRADDGVQRGRRRDSKLSLSTAVRPPKRLVKFSVRRTRLGHGSVRSFGLGRRPSAPRSVRRVEPVVPQAHDPLGREDHDQDRDHAHDQRMVLPVRRHDLAHDDEDGWCRRAGRTSVPAPPTIAHTTASPDT